MLVVVFTQHQKQQPMEMAVNYMRNVFGGVFGMDIIEEVIIEGHNAAR